jgi:hypothetical protein
VVTAVAQELLDAYSPPRPVRLLGVRVSGFDRAPAEQDEDSEPEPEAGTASQLELG